MTKPDWLNLEKDERIVWRGKPRPIRYAWHYFRWVGLVGLFAFAAMVLFDHLPEDIWPKGMQRPATGGARMIALMCFIFPAGSALYATMINYALTTRRAVRKWGIDKPRIENTPLTDVGIVEITSTWGGIGNLIYKIRFQESYHDGQYTAGLIPEGFIAIRSVDDVARLMLDACDVAKDAHSAAAETA